uniref:ATP synthase F0 subunit 8 n=1 Tax=Dinocampus coccinellae TaxID=144245 RepID=A0A343YVC5_9HYME|nr:ATP synthase F0 subunit 8 [Dinocampus coccinellae]
MPQMSPMDWLMLMFYFLFIYMIMMYVIYFFISYSLMFSYVKLPYQFFIKWY